MLGSVTETEASGGFLARRMGVRIEANAQRRRTRLHASPRSTVGAEVPAAPAVLRWPEWHLPKSDVASGSPAPRWVREFRQFVRRGVLGHGFARVRGRRRPPRRSNGALTGD